MVDQAFASELGDTCGGCGNAIPPYAEMVVIASGVRQAGEFGVRSWRKTRCKACADRDGYHGKPVSVADATSEHKPEWGSVQEMIDYFRSRFAK